jgi:hypothetical protein
MIRPQPLVVLDDVEAGSRWFCDVLGLTSGHGGAEYEMLMDDNEFVAQLHLWDAHEHPHLGDRADPSRGNGVLLWFTTDDFDAVVRRVADSGTEVLEAAAFNANAAQHEIWIRGPEGYTVVVSSLREPLAT